MNLSQTANFTRRGVLVFIGLIILGTISFIGYKVWDNYRIANLPPVEEKPENKFGILPAVPLPNPTISSANFTYTLDTQTGGLPTFEKIAKVYFIPMSAASLLAPEKTQDLAKRFNLDIPPQILSETKYQFQKDDIGLTVDLDTENFIYQKSATSSAIRTLEEDDKIISGLKSFLSFQGVMKPELSSGKTKIELLKITEDKIATASSRIDANVVKIYLWPDDIDEKPIVTGDFNTSLISAILTNGGRDLKDYFLLDFIFWPVDITTFSTYPIKNSQQAFENLQSGLGVIVLTPTKPQVSITSIYLAYYESKTYTPYLQPIYVFEGPGFVALVPAITDELASQTK